MKAIFIDAKNKKVSDIEISDENTLQQWYKIIGCDLVEIATYINGKGDSLLVDEEGLFKVEGADYPYFTYEGAHQPFAGNGLIVGEDEDGNSTSPTVTAKDVAGKIVFLTYTDTL